MAFPIKHTTLLKLQPYFSLDILYRIRPVENNVPSNLNAEISRHSSMLRRQGVCRPKHFSRSGDCFFSFPNHANDWSRHHVISKFWEERLFDKIFDSQTMQRPKRSKKTRINQPLECWSLFWCHLRFYSGKRVSFCFEMWYNVTDNFTLDAITWSIGQCMDEYQQRMIWFPNEKNDADDDNTVRLTFNAVEIITGSP